jgi:hypothetical protein
MSEKTVQEDLRELVGKMRDIAAQIGPLHAWWEIIFDVEAFIAGKPTLLKKTGPEYADLCIAELEKSRSAPC